MLLTSEIGNLDASDKTMGYRNRMRSSCSDWPLAVVTCRNVGSALAKTKLTRGQDVNRYLDMPQEWETTHPFSRQKLYRSTKSPPIAASTRLPSYRGVSTRTPNCETPN